MYPALKSTEEYIASSECIASDASACAASTSVYDPDSV